MERWDNESEIKKKSRTAEFSSSEDDDLHCIAPIRKDQELFMCLKSQIKKK